MRSSSDDVNKANKAKSNSIEIGIAVANKEEISVTKDYSSFDDDFQIIGNEVVEVFCHGNSQNIVLNSKADGGHKPTTLYYRSLFDIEDSTDIIENFDLSQDKINLSLLMQALGEDLSLDNVKFVLSNKTDLKLIVYDGPQGYGNEYHVLTLKSVINNKNISISATLKNCVII